MMEVWVTRRQVRRQRAGLGGGPKNHADDIETWARAALHDDPALSFVIAGHSHLPVIIEVAPGRYYLNAGDWISHFTYAEIPDDDSPPTIRSWTSTELTTFLGG